jgi:hypothetical protein
MTDTVSSRKDILAIRIQLFFSCNSTVLAALKKATVATKDATKESIAKNCPICPGNKCSPKNSMSVF